MSNWQSARSPQRDEAAACYLFLFQPKAIGISIVILLVVLLQLTATTAAADYGSSSKDNQCPVECACLGNTVDCSGLGLIHAPSGLPPWTDVLALKQNSLKELKHESLLHLTKLRELDLSYNKFNDNFKLDVLEGSQLRSLKIVKNQLTRIPIFLSIKSLQYLSLAFNSITEINGTALLNLPGLQTLDLSGNKITVIKAESFLSPNRLEHLNLNANKIHTIDTGSLDNLTSLRFLTLNKNHLTHVKDIFNLEKLRSLELNRNRLQQIQGLSFKNLTNLKELRLQRNKIETIDDGAFWPLKNLKLLQLDFNALRTVKKGGMFGLETLEKFTMAHNKISQIELQAWDLCKEITGLDLSNNELTAIYRETFEYLTKLKRLKLDNNQIVQIANGAFNNTPNLQILELNFNKIADMEEDFSGVFLPLGQLTKLSLAHNSIKSIDKNTFVGLTKLTELNLVGNNITSIGNNAFASMPSLENLNANSSSLVCDCGLQWLSVWLHDHKYSGARVKCGYPFWLQGKFLANLHRANFTCEEYPKPRIIDEPKSQMSIKGHNVTLTCKVSSTADAPIQFTWKHDNVEIKNRSMHNDTSSLNNGVMEATSHLNLYNVTHANAGKYQCMITNSYGTTYSGKAKLSVLTFPTFTKVPRDIRVTTGGTARLECFAKGEPTPQIAWTKDGGNYFPAARERRMHMMPTDDVLFILNVKTADSGVYSCTAQNLAGVIVANATLTILGGPTFVKPMENKEIIAGGSVVLECMAGGSPRPKLTWRKNSSPLQATERHFFTAEDQLLIIVNTVPSDAGEYQCEMSNSLGSVVGTSYLTINPAPSSIVNEDDILGLIIITVVCCAVGTSIVWVVIIYQTRRRLNAAHTNGRPTVTTIISTAPDAHLYDTSSQHSKDSGTGDSTNPSSDQLQLCLPEEIVTINGEEDANASGGADPLLHYTNHERNEHDDCEV